VTRDSLWHDYLARPRSQLALSTNGNYFLLHGLLGLSIGIECLQRYETETKDRNNNFPPGSQSSAAKNINSGPSSYLFRSHTLQLPSYCSKWPSPT
jgi:hypothetical protein